jgi:hypothetical protein
MPTGSCIRNRTSGLDPYKPPPSCHPGETYERTKGYVKIAGDVCTVSNDDKFRPDKIPCRFEYVVLLIILFHTIRKCSLSACVKIYGFCYNNVF